MLPTDLVSTVPKPILLATYGIVASTLCLMPVLACAARVGSRAAWLPVRLRRAVLYALFGALFVGCFWFGHGADGVNFSVLILITALLLSVVNGNFDRLVFAGTFTTLFVSRMLIWWRQSVETAHRQWLGNSSNRSTANHRQRSAERVRAFCSPFESG